MLQEIKKNINWTSLIIGIVIGATAVYFWNKYQNKN